MVERGFSVVCVEAGAALAQHARANLAGLPATVHVAPFEQWPGKPESFDLVVCSNGVALARFVGPLPKGAPVAASRRSSRVLERTARLPAGIRSLLHGDPGGL